MDNFMENPWFVRIIAMVLAFLLFISVNGIGKNASESRPNGMENYETETIPNVPVEVYYDSENLVVTGMPETVDVILEGQRRFVEAAKRQRDFTVFVDLSELEIGRHRVPILYSDFSDKLKVTIDPNYVEISLQEKVTEEFSVEAEFNNRILGEGFEAEVPVVEPKTVKVTGAKSEIEKIFYVKATIDARGLITSTVKREARVTVLDQYLNKLDVVVMPENVTVTIPVTNPRKTVPLKITQTGNPPENVVIEKIEPETEEVMVFGRTESLNAINEVELEVDVSNITDSGEIELPIKYPPGVNKITPENIKLNVTVQHKKEEVTNLNEIPIESIDLADGLEVEILSPADGTVSIKLEGNKAELEKAVQDEFEVFFNSAELEPGEHEVDLKVNGPESVKWELPTKKAKVLVKEKSNV